MGGYCIKGAGKNGVYMKPVEYAVTDTVINGINPHIFKSFFVVVSDLHVQWRAIKESHFGAGKKGGYACSAVAQQLSLP